MNVLVLVRHHLTKVREETFAESQDAYRRPCSDVELQLLSLEYRVLPDAVSLLQRVHQVFVLIRVQKFHVDETVDDKHD